MNPQLVTDFFWILTLLVMGVFCYMLIRSHLQPSAAYWFGLLICAAAVNIVGVILTDLAGSAHPMLGWRAISLGRSFIPYCLLGFSLVFPYRRQIARSGFALCLLSVPSLITMVATDPCFASNRRITEQLPYLVPWMGAYFLWSYLNLAFSFRRTRLRATRRQHVLLCVAAVPTTATHYATSILLPVLGLDELWRYNWIPILIAFTIFLAITIRFGTMRRYARLSRFMLDKSITAAGWGSRMVTHTVKNNLQLIRSLAEVACKQQETESRLTRIIQLCDELTEKMNKLNILDRGTLCRADERFLITEPLGKAMERIEPHLGKVTISRTIEGSIPVVRGERLHLEEVFYNLLLNAVEAMPEGGTIRVEIGIENDLAVVGIHDQGPGIAPDQLAKIFEPFHTTKGSEKNWGIGLSYCHLVVVRLGGDLFIESTPGVGCSFFVVLPLTGLYEHAERTAAHRMGLGYPI